MIYENEYNLNVTITSRRQLIELIEIYFNVCTLVKIPFKKIQKSFGPLTVTWMRLLSGMNFCSSLMKVCIKSDRLVLIKLIPYIYSQYG